MSGKYYSIQSISEFDNFNKPYHVISLLPEKELSDKDYHRHDYYEIMLFEKGGGEHIIDFNSLKIDNYSVHFVLPGQVHKLKRKKHSNGFAVLFSEEFILVNKKEKENTIFELPFYNNTLPCSLPLTKNEFNELGFLIQKIELEEKQNEGHDKIAGAYINLLLLILQRACNNFVNQSGKEISGKTGLLIAFKRLLEKNFASGMKPGEYGKHLNITTGYLNDILKEAFNKTTGELLQERIVLEGKRLLFHTDLTINEVAYKLGFEDPAYFARLFRKNTGLTPKDYRVSSRKKS